VTAAKPPRPTLVEEKRFYAQGLKLVAGVDEAGRGALAGPVVAAAVIMPYPMTAAWASEVNDCKLLTPTKRADLDSHIREKAIAIGVGTMPVEVIDSHNILQATILAMKQAVAALSPTPQALLVDYLHLPDITLPQNGITDGDQLCFSIACASIVAKVARDGMMTELDARYPGYGFARHKGYGTPEHLGSLCQLGPCPIHRRSFAPVRETITR
jgi:ribonuclease HII